jgi:5-methylcytosine-specific restriction protein B
MPVPEAYTTIVGATEEIAQTVCLPIGLGIVAAMNSTDRSVAPLDAAMRRRFTIIRVRPDYQILAEHLNISWEDVESRPLPADNDPANWIREDVAVLAIRLLQALNDRIEICLGEDFMLGHALVWSIDSSNAQGLIAELALAVDNKIIPTLRMTFVDQDDALAAILGVPDTATVLFGQAAPIGTVAYWHQAPAALAAIAPKRLTVALIQEMSPQAQLAAIKSLMSY